LFTAIPSWKYITSSGTIIEVEQLLAVLALYGWPPGNTVHTKCLRLKKKKIFMCKTYKNWKNALLQIFLKSPQNCVEIFKIKEVHMPLFDPAKWFF
jgi:hypothetical protein